MPKSKKTEPLFTVAQIRRFEGDSAEQLSDGRSLLMERAGAAVFKRLIAHYSSAVCYHIVCGSGNNGGDGFVLARIAQANGVKVFVYIDKEPSADDARLAFQAMKASGIGVLGVDQLEAGDGIIVDCILGVGIESAPREPWGAVIRTINESEALTIAVDVPSGLCADTGTTAGATVIADMTISFIGHKPGLYTGMGPAHCGRVLLETIGASTDNALAGAELITAASLQGYLPVRQMTAHKGHYGHVLVIGGDAGYGGAAVLAATAALRSGAGLVSVITHASHAASFLSTRPELMVNGFTPDSDISTVDKLMDTASVIVIGPGLGQGEFGKRLYRRVVAHMQSNANKIVVDADALNIMASSPVQLSNTVLTPHPGEAGRLLGVSSSQINADRFAAARAIADTYAAVTLLKGAGSVIADHSNIYLCREGNPGMASGGMGDVLSGIVGGLMAQGLSCIDAAVAGTWIHASSADHAVKKHGVPGLLASDLIDELEVSIQRLS